LPTRVSAGCARCIFARKPPISTTERLLSAAPIAKSVRTSPRRQVRRLKAAHHHHHQEWSNGASAIPLSTRSTAHGIQDISLAATRARSTLSTRPPNSSRTRSRSRRRTATTSRGSARARAAGPRHPQKRRSRRRRSRASAASVARRCIDGVDRSPTQAREEKTCG